MDNWSNFGMFPISCAYCAASTEEIWQSSLQLWVDKYVEFGKNIDPQKKITNVPVIL